MKLNIPHCLANNFIISEYENASSHLLHSKWVSLFMVQVFFQVEEGVKEYVAHSAAFQIAQGYLA